MGRQFRNLGFGRALTVFLPALALVGGCGLQDTEPASVTKSGLTFTTVNLPATTASLNVTLPPLTAAEQTVLAFGARNALKIDDRARTTGLGASAGTVTMGNDGSVGALTATGAVTIGDRSHVTGALRTGATATLGHQSTAGSIQQRLALPPTALINTTVNVPAATQNVTAAPNEVATLAPGSYGQLTVFSGARLTLSAGTYFLRGLDLEPQAQLIVTGPVTVHVAGSLIFRGSIADGGDATRFRLFYFGAAAVRFDTPFRGRVIAPAASIILAGGNTTGFCYAASLEISPDTSWTGIPSPLSGLSPVPTLTARGVTFSATQGVSFTGVVATFTDSNPTDAAVDFTATVAWGDGTTSAGVVGGANGMFTVSGTHTYAASGTFTVTVTVRHGPSGATATATSTATVGRQLAASGVMFSATQGFPFMGQVAGFTDANTADTAAIFTASINWGDGTTSAGVVGGAAGMFTVSGTHTYVSTGTFTVTVTITDTANGATATATSTALVGTLGATGVTFSPTQGVPFTGTVANLFDANTADTAAAFTATIAWGDGTTSAGVVTGSGGTFVVAGTHTYANAGTFTVTVSVVHNVSGVTATATSTALVGRELSATGVSFTALTGVPFTGTVANLTDANTTHTAATFTTSISWGDGATSNGVVTGGAGTFTIAGTHTYATVGTFTVTVSITNTASGATAMATSTATVVSSLQFQVWGVTFNASPGVFQPGIVVAHVVDTNPAAAGALSGTIDWGDGTAPSVAVFFASPLPGNFDVVGAHTFPTSGTFTVTVTATDTTNGATTGALSTAVVTPQLFASGTTFSGAPGAMLLSAVVGHVTDTNPLDGPRSLSATVDWGDGTPVSPVNIASTAATGAFDVTGNHTYAASGTFAVKLVVVSTSGATATATSTASIGPQLAATGVTFTAVQGVQLSSALIGHLADTNLGDGAGAFLVTADWGDGTGGPGPASAVATPVAGVFDLTSSHTYLAEGTFTVQISVTTVAGATASATSTVVVGNPLTGTGATFTTQPGIPNRVLVGHVVDANPFDAASSLTATADWGDGASSTLAINPSAQTGVFDLLGSHEYRTAGTYSVRVVVIGNFTSAVTVFESTAVVSPASSLTSTTSYMVAGVDTPVLIGHIIDANPSDNQFFVSVNWGDGTTPHLGDFTASAAPGVWDVTSRHSYAQPGLYEIELTVIVTATQESLFVLAHANVVTDPAQIPQLVASGARIDAVLNAPLPPPATSPGLLVGSFVTQDLTESAGDFAVTIDWGDGTTSSTSGGGSRILSAPVGANTGAFDVFSPHTYFAAGTFTINLTVTDLITGVTSTATSTATVPSGPLGSGAFVTNAIPGVAASTPGFLVASFANRSPFVNPSDFSVTVIWGDGTTSSTPNGVLLFPVGAIGTFDVFATHAYATTGAFTVFVDISSAAAGSTRATTTVLVTPALTASGTAVNAIPGVLPPQPGFLVASFVDADVVEPASSFAVTVDWGDGTPPSSTGNPGSPVTVAPPASPQPGTFNVFSPHTYASSGTFTITVTIHSATTGGTVTATSTATTSPQLLASGTNINAVPTVAPTPPGFLVASFVDANRSEPLSDLAVTVDWGDGTPPSSTGTGAVMVAPVGSPQAGTFDVFASHTYATSGTFDVTVAITSASTGATATAVSTARPSAQLLASGAGLEAAVGAPIPPGTGGFVVASVIDAAGTASPDALSATINWGDGTPPTTTGTTTNGVLTTFLLGGVPGTFDLATTHTYATAGTFTATITITETITGPPPLVSTTTTTTSTARFQVGS